MDTKSLLPFMGLFGLAAIGALIFAINLSYRIERLKRPDLPRPRMIYTNIFASAFGAAPEGEGARLRTQLRIALGVSLTFLLAIAIVATSAEQRPTPEEQAAADALLAPQPAHLPGTTLYYTRSNQDGSKPERVLIHINSPTEISVAKMVDRCTDAALVTARFDPRTGEARQLIGGRLQRDGTQAPQAWLDYDAEAGSLDVRMESADSDPAETLASPGAPWRMYDFDLAEFALYGPRTPDDFSFGLAMAWPDGSTPTLRSLGKADAVFMDSGLRIGNPYNLFAVSGEAFGGPDGDGGGLLMLDAMYGHVIEARFGAPNHPGYDDFLLRLDYIAPAYEGEDPAAFTGLWREELLAHWADCP